VRSKLMLALQRCQAAIGVSAKPEPAAIAPRAAAVLAKPVLFDQERGGT